MTNKERLLRSTVLAGVAALTMGGAPVFAQEAEQTSEQEEQAEASDDRVVITGSRLRRNEFTSSSPIQVINAETAALQGMVDTAELIQGSSVAAGSVQFNNQFGGFVVEGGTGINSVSLRGLGAQRSLVLLNGRRPGPAGSRGQVGAFDLNVIPTAILQRAEILKDGAGSVYGSDAVAGVVNLITLTSVDEPTVTAQYNAPFESGGETYEVSGAYGLNFDTGNVVLAAEWGLREDLSIGDRDYLSCPRDGYTDPQGNNIDREDRSILAGTELSGCNNIYFNTFIDAIFGDRYIPSPDGVTIGGVPGYRPRQNGRYDDAGGEAFYEDVLNTPEALTEDAINKQERFSFYSQSNFTIFNGIEWNTEFLYSYRKTTSEGWRQFFPLTGGATSIFAPTYTYANDPGYVTPVASGIAQPVLLFPSNSEVEVNYYSLASGLDGGFGAGLGFLSDWNWALDAVYSRSDADYGGIGISAERSGDVRFDDDAPVVDYYSPDVLAGNQTDALVDAVGVENFGNTVYEQTTVTGYVTGDLFTLPAGPVGLVLGAEYRTFSIDDQPSEASRNGDLWGSTSAQVTAGEDTVVEAFAEIEVPLLAGQPLFEELTLNASGRVFDYDSAGSDSVYKVGLNWQINPLVRMRATQGTSFRAPALYELFLGNQSSFVGQLAIDPCVDWGESNNDNIRTNCAALGIPADFAGGPSSATVLTGGGDGVLTPETSDALTIGAVFTPTDLNLSIAVDYFEIQVDNQISQLGSGSIVSGCYNADNFPNNFCTLFDRNGDTGGNDAFAITEVRDSYINVNKQRTEGVDVTVRYDHEFDFGDLILEGQGTFTFENVEELFDPALESGFDSTDFTGRIGYPEFVGNARVAFQRGDWTASWFMDYVAEVSEEGFFDRETTYFGADAIRDIEAEAVIYHDASVLYQQPTWSVLVGVSNVFDEHPPTISSGSVARRGNVPVSGSQYDLRGRTAFVRLNKTF
ncbi:TonB-dependent receptor plug domain-containing protein [Oceanicaulis alexandrii]|uniref:TonB-dependent receptor plug domain-containing protein n=1 Tax=Oceanicaulis alexandrii TaxID=153233 RepID=UPI0023578E32|nr:TonB-dependent receptor [Oceanicaulis alexandrii]